MTTSRKLKIAYLSHGSMIHTLPYCRYFHSRGHQVTCITITPPTIDFGVPVRDISSSGLTRSKLFYLASIHKLRNLLSELKPDILHGQYITSAGLSCWLSGFYPYVLTVHGGDLIKPIKKWVWRTLLKRICGKAALVNTVSDELAELVVRLGVSREKIFTATLGVDLDRFDYQPHESFASSVRLLCTRTIGEVYDPETIVNACRILKEKNFPFALTFASSGPLEVKIKKMVADADLEDRISFLGGFDNASLPKILHSHDLYISASRFDGTSISLLETMACGLFPLVSRIPSNQKWLTEGETGLMFNVGDAEELARNVIQFCTSVDWVKTAVESNRQLVERWGNRVKNMEELETRYYHLLGQEKNT